ncbi:hypothetical protein GH714_003923 [Hevea brasiliensis]|uniref:Isopenicillin N synthase-like Fe(2+) 2OG dioxygenase domain-containing protein n=1 Tax=Hevea brasiliensis TaxID=3981 RepID=A0A6A6KXB5_HEVBR|nr:hypothetical protein GH714_003923 [Hevea brasiliensis]
MAAVAENLESSLPVPSVQELVSQQLHTCHLGSGILSGFQEGTYDVRFNCYPPCPQPDRVIGMIPHADMSGITLLLDATDVPGLQIMSNRNIQSTRSQSCGEQIEGEVFCSYFCYPNPSVKIGPASELTQSGSPPLYKTVTLAEYFQSFYNRKLEVSFIDCLKSEA